MRAYIDSDILIWHLRGDIKALKFFEVMRSRREYELWIGAMQRAEVVFFMREGEEDSTMYFLSQFTTAPVTGDIIDVAGRLYRLWNPSHGTDINDAILAATVQNTGGKLYCLNKKHYPMPDLVVEPAWSRR